ncbi:GrpB family protein [Rhizobium sp. 3T7]|uniref:GrpB family protein n=1 Tax=Rhizobium sp. 3T7 TaxID=2874922 RepID=UPI001CCD9147|nr:GrpB family protein [Rhizobium sp. 3T7]MBZ9791908.1 GrpB family protein [Rhizobium sp. 3T7]
MPTLVELVPYDPNWTKHFSDAEAALRATLGSSVMAVDHVGSTRMGPRVADGPDRCFAHDADFSLPRFLHANFARWALMH